MRGKSGSVRQDVRPYGQKGGSGRERGPLRPAMDANAAADPASEEKSDAARRAILDATLACFATHGWSGTNMSVIARRSRMTRGRIQYYFPTLDDLLRAAIGHLMVEWRRKYFGALAEVAGTSARFETGVDLLWRLMQDPLHIAKQELEASARTNTELRALIESASVDDEEASVSAAKLTYPELARRGDGALRLARNFTNVFMEGLALYRFNQDAAERQAELIDMLKGVLIAYWRSLGVDSLEDAVKPGRKAAVTPPRVVDQNRDRALALLQEAAALLSADTQR